MAIDKVREYFKGLGFENRIREFDESSATVSLAAKALNCSEDKIAKTMAFDVLGNYIVIVMDGTSRIDNSKFKHEFNTKAKMVSADNLVEYIGHEMGGVCPFALNDGVDVYLDESLRKHDKVYPACGSSNSAIELTIEELEKYSNFNKWIDISK